MPLKRPLSAPHPDAPPVRWLMGLLAGRSPSELPADPGWAEVEELLRFHGLEGLAFAVHRKAGDLLPARWAARLEPAYRRGGLQAQLAVEAGRRARGALEGEGIPVLLFKGTALVEAGIYDDPGARPMDDADLLVRPEHADRAMRILARRGFRPWSPWEPGTVQWLDSATLYDNGSPPVLPVSIDLHWRLGYGGLRFGPDGDARGDPWRGSNPEEGLPDPGVHLVILAEHFLKHLRHKVHLRALGDLARLAPRIDAPDRTRAVLAASPHAAAIRDLLRGLAGEGARIPPSLHSTGRGLRLPGWKVPSLERPGRLAGRRSPVEGRVRGILFRARLLSGPGAFLRDALRTMFPPASWLRARYPGEGGGGKARLPALWIRYMGDGLDWLRGVGTSPVSPNQAFEDPPAGRP